jgi:hypothetical protein
MPPPMYIRVSILFSRHITHPLRLRFSALAYGYVCRPGLLQRNSSRFAGETAGSGTRSDLRLPTNEMINLCHIDRQARNSLGRSEGQYTCDVLYATVHPGD